MVIMHKYLNILGAVSIGFCLLKAASTVTLLLILPYFTDYHKQNATGADR